MKIGLVQTNPQRDLNRNLREIEASVLGASQQGAHVVVIPEMFACMGEDAERVACASRHGEGVFKRLGELAQRASVYLVGGSHGELPPDSEPDRRIFNSHQTFAPDGSVIFTYRKVHLFNLRSRSGELEFRESAVFQPGEVPEAPFRVQVEGVNWACLTLICYDLRFPEIFRQPAWRQSPPDIFFLPAAFTKRTGQAHWEALLRARAIENQCFLVACNQTGSFCEGRKVNYGHSMVVSPWGEVLLDMGDAEGLALVDIDHQRVSAARQQIPSLDNRVVG
jgi:predicted amidohydrolase